MTSRDARKKRLERLAARREAGRTKWIDVPLRPRLTGPQRRLLVLLGKTEEGAAWLSMRGPLAAARGLERKGLAMREQPALKIKGTRRERWRLTVRGCLRAIEELEKELEKLGALPRRTR